MVIRFALNTLALLWYASVALVIYLGWTIADRRYIIPESGTGYWLGIIGGVLMLLLLVYPQRKKHPHWTYLGSIRFWFRLHMILGVVGPTFIIFHSGYQLGSLNSRIAFFSMLVVAGSGLIGRYLYSRIHHGLYGKKVEFEDLYIKSQACVDSLKEIGQQSPDLARDLAAIEKDLANRHTGINRSLWFYLSRRWKLRGIRRRTIAGFPRSEARRTFLDRVWSLRSICNLGINEILFSFWHVLHYPLFIMMVISALFHVFVVHFY